MNCSPLEGARAYIRTRGHHIYLVREDRLPMGPGVFGQRIYSALKATRLPPSLKVPPVSPLEYLVETGYCLDSTRPMRSAQPF